MTICRRIKGMYLLGIAYLCVLLCHTSWSICTDDMKLSQTDCPGPLAFYESIGCISIKKDGEFCAKQYNCDKVKSLPSDKCYVTVDGQAYDIGEPLKEEDTNPCDISCTCNSDMDGKARFECAIVDCFLGPVKPGCYRKNSPLNCCPGEEVCPEDPEDRAECMVNGRVYKDGEHFSVESDPELNCICQPGYEGKNVEPFCVRPKHPYCSALFKDPKVIRKDCAPVYYSSQRPQTSCTAIYRCQNDKDKVIKSDKSTETGGAICHFGSLVLERGDKLNQATDYNSVCVECVCEVPPTLTCQRLPDEKCDVTKHPNFMDHVQDSVTSMVNKIPKELPFH